MHILTTFFFGFIIVFLFFDRYTIYYRVLGLFNEGPFTGRKNGVRLSGERFGGSFQQRATLVRHVYECSMLKINSQMMI